MRTRLSMHKNILLRCLMIWSLAASFWVGTWLKPWSAAAQTPNTIAWDDLDSNSVSGGIGWADNWTLSGNAAFSQERLYTGSTYNLRLRAHNGVAARVVNLSGVTNARLKFLRRARSFEGADYATVVINDGANHEVLRVIDGQDTDTYVAVDIDLSGFNMTSNFTIRFESHMGNNDTGDQFYIENIEVTGTRPCSYGPYAVPGRVEAENYTCGPSGIAYYDSTAGNSGGVYRSEDVDIQATSDAGGGYNVTGIVANEWLVYRVNVATTGAYNISFRTASTASSKRVNLQIWNGTAWSSLTGDVTLPNTGGAQVWQTTVVYNISLTAGSQVLRLLMVDDGFNVNYIDFGPYVPATPTSTPTATPTNTPTATPTLTPTPVCSQPALNFSSYTVSKYGTDTDSGSVTVEDGGATLRIVGNVWKKINFPWVIVPGTILEFDFRGAVQGEIQGIGMDDDNTQDQTHVFQLYGTQTWGNQTYRDYAPSAPGWRHYVIPIGTFFTGDMLYMTFVGDHDASPNNGDSRFSNVRICGGGVPTPTPTPSPTPTTIPGRWARYDNFEICPVDQGNPDTRPKPPGLQECGNVIVNPDMEQTGILLQPWVLGLELNAVMGSSRYSCDPDGRPTGFNKGNYSMLLQCDRPNSWPYEPAYNPLAYQQFTVPRFISPTEPVLLEMMVSLYYVVPPAYNAGQGPYQGTQGRAEDALTVVIQDESGNDLTQAAYVTHGAISTRGTHLSFKVDMEPKFLNGSSLRNYIGDNLRLALRAPNTLGNGDSDFYVDQIKCELCTTVLEPPLQPGKVRRLGGNVRVIMEGKAKQMQGIDVWATQLQTGSPPAPPIGQLDFQATYTIQDSTYSFYNLTPGRYLIYAEVWASGNMYSASATVDVVDGEDRRDINLTLN